MPQHSSDLENFTIHLVAILFIFSTITAAFLGYGIYNPNQKTSFKTVTKAHATDFPTWKQTSWNGGASSSVYTINWRSVDGWTKYSAASNVTFGASGFTINPGGYLQSSIFNNGQSRAWLFLVYSWDNNKLQARGANTEGGISSAAWITAGTDWCQLISYPYVQYRIESFNGSTVNVEYVEAYGLVSNIRGYVKDASTGNPISGATVNYGSGSTSTSSTGFYDIESEALPSTTINLTVSKSGYTSQAKSVTIPQDICDSGGILYQNFNLNSASSSSSNQKSSENGTSSTESPTSSSTGPASSSEKTVSLNEFQKIRLPSIFTTKGSQTTDLSKVKDPTKVENFTIDIPGKSKIVFNAPLDLSAESTVKALENLTEYVKSDKVGIVELDTKALPAFNKSATITMYNIEHLFTPEILVDGKQDTQGIVSNIQYDLKTNTLTFEIFHSTIFSAVPKLELLTPQSKTVDKADVLIGGRVSDPAAVVTGWLNGVKLSSIQNNKQNGIFSFAKIKLQEGENTLVVKAESKLGKVLPIKTTISYSPANVTSGEKSSFSSPQFIAIVLVSLAFALLLSFLVYRKRKRIERILAELTHREEQKTIEQKPK